MVLATQRRAQLGHRRSDLYAVIVALYWIRNVLPLAALFFATSLVADEVEGRTLTYLITRPLTRPSIFVGKFAAYLVTTLSLALPAGVADLLHAAERPRLLRRSLRAVGDLLRDLGVMAARPASPTGRSSRSSACC